MGGFVLIIIIHFNLYDSIVINQRFATLMVCEAVRKDIRNNYPRAHIGYSQCINSDPSHQVRDDLK